MNAGTVKISNYMTLPQYREYMRTGKLPPPPPGELPPLIPDELPETKADRQAEDELQGQCENWLSLRGYMNMTAHNAVLAKQQPVKGWYGHLHNAKRNPLMPDLFIFSPGQQDALMVELKTASRYQDGQPEMIELGAWREVRTFDSFCRLVEKWEGRYGQTA